MNIKEEPLHSLVLLWQVSGGNPQFRTMIQSELNNRIATNINFTIEFFVHLDKVRGHAANVSFIPGSESYSLYGEHITIKETIMDEEEFLGILKNISAEPPVKTYGRIKVNVLKDKLTPEQLDSLRENGFNTKDVYEVLHI